jgi:hypothetical protein
MEMPDRLHAAKLSVLFAYFCALAFILWNFQVGYPILPILVLSAAVWLLYEYSLGRSAADLKDAALIGLFLMLFDFAVQNAGGALGLWQIRQTALHVVYVPIDIMLLTLIGGTAWALAQPKRFNPIDSALDIALFSVFGMIGEFLLMKNGIMMYSGGWTSAYAFAGYLVTFIALTWLRYRVPIGAR